MNFNKPACATAYELECSAFDSACDYAQETVGYIQDYAFNVYGICVGEDVAQKILDCRQALKQANEQNGEWQNNRYQLLQEPLEQITLD